MEKRELFGYELHILPITDFKEYYKTNLNLFSTFAEKKFLTSAGIPGGYYLEQPDGTKEDLLNNKEQIVPETLSEYHLVTLLKEGRIENACRLKYDNFIDVFERVSSLSTCDGYIEFDSLTEGVVTFVHFEADPVVSQYNPIKTVDVFLMCNKPPILNTGYKYCCDPASEEEIPRSFYSQTETLAPTNYQTPELFINSTREYSKPPTEYDQPLLKDLEHLLTELSGLKEVPKGYIKKIPRYIKKNSLCVVSIYSFVHLLLQFEEDFKRLKSKNRFRGIIKPILQLLGA